MFCTTTFALLVIFFTAIYWYLKRKYFSIDDRAKKIPGLKPEWLVGNLRNTGMLSGQRVFHEVYIILKEKYGDVFSFSLGPNYGVVLSRVEHVRYVFADRQTYDQSGETIKVFSLLFPNGLIALRGNDWKRHARYMLPMFRRAKITPYLDTIVDCVDRSIDKHFVHDDKKIHTDLFIQLQQLMMNVIAHIAFDYDLEQTSSVDQDVRRAFNDFVHYGAQFLVMALFPRWLGKLYLMVNWKFRNARRILRQRVMQIIAKEEENQQEQHQNSARSNKPKNLIASLVKAMKEESVSSTEPSLTPDEVFDETLLSILAGFETTSTVLSWFIFYMSKYPEVQQKIKDELKEYHLTPDALLSQEILDSLVYVECVVKEVLRFAPTAASVTRQATRDDMIDDIPVRKGDLINLAIYNLHFDPRYWNIDPSKFLPERWLDEDKSPPHCVYMPFGGGHRACAGQELAFFELKTVIARLMQRVTFEDPGEEANNSGGFLQRITCFPKHLAVRVYMDSQNTTA